MKITRINRIRNYRIFRDFSWPDELPDFARFNVIYGWNGAGKTTLSHLLLHLQKKLLITEGEVEFRFGQNNVSGANLSTAAIPSIKIFNRDFVSTSFFEEPGQKFSPIYYLGEESVETKKKIEELKSQSDKASKHLAATLSKKQRAENALNTFAVSQAKIIKEALSSAGQNPYNNYDKRGFLNNASKLTSSTYATNLLDAKKKITLREKLSSKPKAKIAALNVEYPDLKSLTDLTNSVLSRSIVSNTIEKLATNPSLAAWVQRGLELHQVDGDSETCEFCGQLIPANRIQHLESHFNDEFKHFQAEIAESISKIEDAKSQLNFIHSPEISLFYEHLAEGVQKEIDAIALHRWHVEEYLNALKKALAVKKESPFQKVDLVQYVGYEESPADPKRFWGITFSILSGVISQFGSLKGQRAVQQINALIDQHNAVTDNFQKEIERTRTALENCYIAEAYKEYEEKKSAFSKANTEENVASAYIKTCQTNIAELEREVVQHRRPAEQLNKEIRAYLGRDELTFAIHENGYSITRHGKPAGNLSEGEKTAIAFLYFLKSLQDKSFDVENGVVVIDDPVSSLDTNSLYSAFGYMKERTKKSGQLFVLTHNFSFFRQVKNWFNHQNRLTKNDARFYMLQATLHDGKRTAFIAKLDPMLHEHESEYHYLFKKVHDESLKTALQGKIENSYGMPNMARRLLEGFLAFRYPNKTGKLYQQLEEINFDAAKKSRIQRFLDTYSHHEHVGEAEHDLSILSETSAVLADVLELIETTDKGHYDGMIEATKPK
ncbi:MAG: AAA family ATPase [Pseudomonadota bacterium]